MPPPPSHPSQSRFGRHPHWRCTPLASAFFYSPVASVFRILCSLRQSRSPPLLSPPPPPPPTPPTLRQQYCCACCLHPSKGLVLDEPRRQRRRWQQAAAVCLPCRRGAWVSLALPVRMCNRARCGVRWTASPPPLAAFAPRRQQQSSGSGDGGGARSAPARRRWRKPLQGGGGDSFLLAAQHWAPPSRLRSSCPRRRRYPSCVEKINMDLTVGTQSPCTHKTTPTTHLVVSSCPSFPAPSARCMLI